MLKRLAILGLLLMPLAPVPRQTTPSASKGGAKPNGDGQRENGPSAPSVAVSNPTQPPENTAHTGEVAAKDTEHSVTLTSVPPLTIKDKQKTVLDHVYDWGPWFFGLFLAIAGGVQLKLLRVTWKAIQEQKGEMAKQTGILAQSVAAAQASADAALLNAQAVINSERPWIRVKIVLSPDGFYGVAAKNTGRTPALIVASSEPQKKVFPVGEALPETPTYGEKRTFNSTLLPDSERTVYWLTESDVRSVEGFERVVQGSDGLYIWGVVQYRDTLNRESENAHETVWCFRYIPNQVPNPFKMAGPVSYNRYT
jgi:hypothetical protein